VFVGREPPKPDIQCYHPRRPEKSKEKACNAMQGHHKTMLPRKNKTEADRSKRLNRSQEALNKEKKQHVV
jgi:hypothetical protein